MKPIKFKLEDRDKLTLSTSTIVFGEETIKISKTEIGTFLSLKGHIVPLSSITAFIKSPFDGPYSLTAKISISKSEENNSVEIGCLTDTYTNFSKFYKKLLKDDKNKEEGESKHLSNYH